MRKQAYLNAVEEHLSNTSAFKANKVRLEQGLGCLEALTAHLHAAASEGRADVKR